MRGSVIIDSHAMTEKLLSVLKEKFSLRSSYNLVQIGNIQGEI